MATSTRGQDFVIVDDARRLTERWIGADRSEHPALLLLLRELSQAPAAEEGGNASGRPIAAKMPVKQEAALSMVVEVETELSRIVRWMGGKTSAKRPAANLLWIGANLDNLSDADVRKVAKHLDGLRRRAEDLLDMSEPRRALQGRCPECTTYGTVIVTFNRIEVKEARCSNCLTTWSPLELGILSTRMKEMDR